jgi:CRP/FNR family cyclic AMP-dependent transcriptional regulator
MPCSPEILKNVSLFALLDDDETAVLAAQVEVRTFAPRQRIYKLGDPGNRAYIVVSGSVEVTTVDEDQQEVLLDRPSAGDIFGFASMIDESAHATSAMALEQTVCIEIDRHDILTLVQAKPHAGLDMMAMLGRQFHAAQQLVRGRAARNPNEIIEEQTTTGDRIADDVASFGGSWKFIITFGIVLVAYTATNIALGKSAWDQYPFILLNLFLSMLAAIQAPVIMMSQNRQDKKDRVRGELDFEVNRRAEAEIQLLAHKLRAMDGKIDDVADLLRANAPASLPEKAGPAYRSE